ncbi:hypothetical protein V2J09_001728 [Rumex salicifolius]
MESSSSSTSKRLNSPAAAVTGKSCPICLRRVDTNRAAVITACLHAYCHGCLLRWTAYKRRCPLCNADFTSYYSNLNQICSRTFRKHRLSPIPPSPSKTFPSGDESRHRHPLLNLRREIRRTRRDTAIGSSSRSRPLPRRRSFGRGENVTSDVIQYRILQWRASIYEQRLRAVPLASRSFLQPNGVLDNAQKQGVIQRLEPWIRRELCAILNDPDPTIIVHVATSIFVSAIEKSRILPDSQDDLFNPLRRFLDGWTDMFWHELRL